MFFSYAEETGAKVLVYRFPNLVGKWEFFIVVSGHGLIEERKIGTDEVLRFEVSGEKIEAVPMLPGYTHNIINLSDTDDLVTVMWANEQFDPEHPDTFGEKV